MVMSSDDGRLKPRAVAQYRPEDVGPATDQRGEGLVVSLALGPLAIVVGPGLGSRAEAGEGRLVEDPPEDLVAASHPAKVADPLAGVMGGGNETGVGDELVGASECARGVTDQELSAQEWPHAGQANPPEPSRGTTMETTLGHFGPRPSYAPRRQGER